MEITVGAPSILRFGKKVLLEMIERRAGHGRRADRAALACLIAAGCAVGGQAAELAPLTMTPIVLSATKSPVARFSQLAPDCIGESPLVVLTRSPAKGQVEIEENMGFSDYPKDSNLYTCNSRRTNGMSVFYTSTESFKGTDIFEVEVFYTSFATSRKVRFRATVK